MLTETMRRISELLQQGQYSAAHAQLESVVAANPDYVEGLRLLAGTKQVLGDVAQAEALLRRAVQVDPTWPPTLTTLAELLLSSGRTVEALPLLQRAVRSSPRAAFLLARLYMDAGQPAAALDVATLWLNSGKADMPLAELLVTAYAALGRQGDGLDHCRRLVTATSAAAPAGVPHGLVAEYALALALNAAQQPAEAALVASSVLSRSRPGASLHYVHARSLIDLERFDEAELACANACGWSHGARKLMTGWRSSCGCAPAILVKLHALWIRRWLLMGKTTHCGPRRLLFCRRPGMRALHWHVSLTGSPDPSLTLICSSVLDWRHSSSIRLLHWDLQSAP